MSIKSNIKNQNNFIYAKLIDFLLESLKISQDSSSISNSKNISKGLIETELINPILIKINKNKNNNFILDYFLHSYVTYNTSICSRRKSFWNH